MTKELSSLCLTSTLRESDYGRDFIPPEHPRPWTDAQFGEYIRGNYFPTVGSDEFRQIIDQYPSGGLWTFSAVSEDTEMRYKRCYSGVSL